MADPIVCLKCRAPLGTDARQGFCAKCLFEQARVADSDDVVCRSGPDFPTGLPRFFGGYELLEEIARGGMGIVFKARQRNLERLVAVKVILTGELASAQQSLRFRAEAEAAARLQHPNIVRIHDAGEEDGQAYFSMDYVEGVNLSVLVREKPLTAQRAARYVKIIAEAIHVAHEQGILHRDLKPSNVLVDATDQPRITDFGLAKRIQADSFLSVTGEVIGSPNFMPPEQTGANTMETGQHSDVYALGGILFYLVTGRPPFVAGSVVETIQSVLNTDPVSPRLLNPSVPQDIATICLKCLEKLPHKRYATARLLAEELGRFLNQEPIHARPITRVGRIFRWSCRNRALAGSLVAVTLLLTAILIGSPIASYRINQARIAEASELMRAEQQLYAADMLLAHAALAENNFGRARELIEKERPRENSPVSGHSPAVVDLRGWEWRYLWRQVRSDEIRTIGIHSNAIVAVTCSPEGKVASASADGVVKIWDENSGGQAESFSCPGAPGLLRFEETGKLLIAYGAVSASGQWSVKLWTPQLQETRVIETGKDSLLAASLSADKTMVAGMGKNWTRLWKENGEALANLPNDNVWMQHGALAFSPGGRLLAYRYGKHTVNLWDVKEGRLTASLQGHSNEVISLAFSADGKWLISGSLDPTAIVWEVGRRELAARLTGHSDRITAVAITSDGLQLVSASADQRIKIWEMESWRELATFQGHVDAVSCVAILAGGKKVVSGGKDGTVRLWSDRPKAVEKTSKVPEPDFFSAQFSPTGETLAIFYDRSATWAWFDAGTLVERGRFSNEDNNVHGSLCAFGPDGRAFAHTDDSADVTAKLWTLTSPRPVGSRSFGRATIKRLAFAPSDSLLAIAEADATIDLWDVNTLTQRLTLGTRSNEVNRLVFASDSSLLAVGYQDGAIEVDDVQQGGRQMLLVGHQDAIRDLWITRDKKSLLSASGDGRVLLWNLSTRRNQVLGGRTAAYNCVAESIDGRRAAAGANDGRIRIWDLASKQEVAVLAGHTQPVRRLFFLPDGNCLVSVSADNIRVWRAAALEEADREILKRMSPIRRR
jgi:eukaryotic-like serine/threonine-protein kinase